MAISVRLDKKTEHLLEQACKILKVNKSEIIKRSVADYCSQEIKERKKRPYELIQDLLEKGGSGRGDLSLKGEEILREGFKRRRNDPH